MISALTSREVHEARCGLVLAAGRVRSKKKNTVTREKEITTKSRPTENTPRNPHQPSDRDQLETARGKTRPKR